MMYWMLWCLLPWLTSCASTELFPVVPSWVLEPVPVADVMPKQPSVRDIATQALVYKHAIYECNARLDLVRDMLTDQ